MQSNFGIVNRSGDKCWVVYKNNEEINFGTISEMTDLKLWRSIIFRFNCNLFTKMMTKEISFLLHICYSLWTTSRIYEYKGDNLIYKSPLFSDMHILLTRV